MFFQDLKLRHIHFAFPLIVFVCSIYLLLQKSESLKIIIYNIVFFLSTFLFLIIYMSLKNRKYINPFKNYFGIGDLVFYISIAPIFYLNNYVIFFILSLIFSLLVQFIFIKKIKASTVPLAGFSSLFLFFLIVGDLTIITKSFNDCFSL